MPCFQLSGTLKTLPPRELSAGLAEIIKYGPIADMPFLDWIEANIDALMASEPAALAHAIQRSCEIKAHVVGQDEREQGLRAILNFGHTFGHAIESGLGYGEWLHGEAVGVGMLLATDLSHRLGWIGAPEVGRVRDLLRRAGLPVEAPQIGASHALSLMGMDKKVLAGRIRLVLLSGLGAGVVSGDYPAETLQQTLAAYFGGAD